MLITSASCAARDKELPSTAANHDRGMRFLDRVETGGKRPQPVMPSGECDNLLAEELLDDMQSFAEALDPYSAGIEG